MAIPVHNVAYYRGDTYVLVANFYKPDGSPVILANGTLESWIVSDLTKPTSSQIGEWSITFNTIPNQAIMKIPPTLFDGESTTIPYYYDVQFTDVDGTVTTFFRGTINIEYDVTDAPDIPVTP